MTCPACRANWLTGGPTRCRRHRDRAAAEVHTCRVKECDRIAEARGLCAAHRMHAYRRRKAQA